MFKYETFVVLPILISLGVTKDMISLVSILLAIIVVDFMTGVLASYVEHIKDPQPIKAYFIESSKIRKSIVKTVSYMVFIIITLVFNVHLQVSEISVFGLTSTLPVLSILICLGVELFSILENLKRSGFDLIGKVIDTVNFVVKLVSKVKKSISKIKSE